MDHHVRASSREVDTHIRGRSRDRERTMFLSLGSLSQGELAQWLQQNNNIPNTNAHKDMKSTV